MTDYKFTLNGLHCANCANKIEAAVNKDIKTKNVSLNFATKTLAFSSTNSNTHTVTAWTQSIVDSIENGVTVTTANNIFEQNKNEKSAIIKKFAKIIIAFSLLALALVCEHALDLPPWLCAVMYSISVITCGYHVFISGFKSILKLQLDENLLMSVAVIAAFCIGEFPEAAFVTLLYSIGEALEDIAVSKSRRNIAKLSEIRPDTANIISNGTTVSVAAAAVKVDDTIIIKPFERVPLDCTVVSGSSSLDASALTGESLPILAQDGALLMSGMMNKEGMLTARVTKTYENSSASRILKLVEEAAATKGNSEKFITKFARLYTPIVLVIAVLLAIVPTLLTGEFTLWLQRALVFLVASCPCAVVISVPLGFYSGIGGISKAGVIIKGGKYIEALAKADTFVFDKTGTLTTGQLTVTNIETTGNLTKEEALALTAAAELHSTHPVAKAIKNYAKDLDLPVLTNYKETAGFGVSANWNGKEIVCGNHRILKDQNSEKGTIYLTVDGKTQAKINVADTLREETPSVISSLRNLNIKTLTMLTGDSKDTAKIIAAQSGLTEFHAELLPEDKLNAMSALKKKSLSTVFIGDGINDAPVIAASDCGIAMGLGSQAAIESSDAVLTSGNLKQLPTAVQHCRRVMNTVRFNIVFALCIKSVILILAALGYAPMWLAVFADTGVSLLCVLNSSRLLKV